MLKSLTILKLLRFLSDRVLFRVLIDRVFLGFSVIKSNYFSIMPLLFIKKTCHDVLIISTKLQLAYLKNKTPNTQDLSPLSRTLDLGSSGKTPNPTSLSRSPHFRPKIFDHMVGPASNNC